MCAPHFVAYLKLVQEFYANTYKTKNDSLEKYYTEVRRVKVKFTIECIRGFLRVEYNSSTMRDFNAMWEANLWNPEEVLSDIIVLGTMWGLDRKKKPYKIKRFELLPIPKAWYTFIQCSLLPSNNNSDVSGRKAYLIWCIMKGVPFGVGTLITDKIEEIAQASPGILGFPFLITRYLLKCEMPIFQKQTIPPARPITAVCISRGEDPDRHPIDRPPKRPSK